MANSNPDNVKRAELWDKTIGQVLNDPSTKGECPVCHGAGVAAAWRLAKGSKGADRTAVFDAWCVLCGERVHSYVKLPTHAADQFSALGS